MTAAPIAGSNAGSKTTAKAVPDARTAARARRRADRKARRVEEAAWIETILGAPRTASAQAAFRLVVERYQRQVYWIAHDILLDHEEARDVAQETFVRVHAALDRFDPTRDLVNWVCRIARNLAIDGLRRRRRRALPTEDLGWLPEDDAETADARPQLEDLSSRVQRVLAELPVEYRLALTLREFHGMAPREIAQVTDCSYPTARWRLHRARNLFRKAWTARFGETPAEASDDAETTAEGNA